MKFNKVRLIECLFGKVLMFLLKPIIFLKRKKSIINKINKKRVKNILIIRTGGIGDTLLAHPFFSKLKINFPNAQLTIIGIIRNKQTLEMLRNKKIINNYICMDNFKRLFFNFKTVFLNKYDLLFDLEQEYRIPALISFFANSPIKIGFDTNERRWCYSSFINYNQDRYETLNFFEQLKVLDINLNLFEKEMILKTDKIILNLPKNFVTISLSADNIQNKLKNETVVDFCKEISKKYNLIFIGGKEDFKKAKIIIETLKIKRKCLNLCGKTSINGSIDILKKSKLFVGYDGGPLHMATCAGCKTISFFGSALENKWNFPSKNHIKINLNYPCSPCMRGRFSRIPKCPYNYKCIKDISSKRIMGEVKKILK